MSPGPLGRLIQVIAIWRSDDLHINVGRRTASHAGVSGSPRTEQVHSLYAIQPSKLFREVEAAWQEVAELIETKKPCE